MATSRTPAAKKAAASARTTAAAAKRAPAKPVTARKAPAVPASKTAVKKAPAKASRPAKSAVPAPAVRVFQAHAEPWQREMLDAAFEPVQARQPEGLDLALWEQLQAQPAARSAALWGAVSWRFAERTGQPGAQWLREIQAQPGADLYFSGADVPHEAVFHNAWLQAETQHPRFLELAAAFLKAAGLPPETLNAISPSGLPGSGTLVVATPAFWARYLPWLRKLAARAGKRLAPPLRELLHAPAPAADGAAPDGAPTYEALILERLLPVFLRSAEGKAFKAVRIPLPAREGELNVHQKLLREMKDVAHRTQSAWLAACWVNYRNLYLGQTQGKPWVQRYLRSITPTEIRFA